MTLFFACVFTAGWVRSQKTIDQIATDSNYFGTHLLKSESSKLTWIQADRNISGGLPPKFGSYPNPNSEHQPVFLPCIQREHGELVIGPDHAISYRGIGIWYGTLVIPLTLLSAWLLLIKPRSIRQPEIANHASRTPKPLA